MQHRNALKSSRRTSLIDIISQGFHAVNRRAWVVAIPILVDLYYWLGPRISIAPLLARIRNLSPQVWDQATQQLGPQVDLGTGTFDLRDWTFPDLLQLLVPNIDVPAPPFTPATWEIRSFAAWLGAVVLINMLGLVFAALYLLPLANTLNGTEQQLGIRRVGRVLVSLVGVVATVVGTVLLSTLLATIGVGIITLVSQAAAQAMIFIWITLLIWFMFVVSFAFDAVVMRGLGPLRAIVSSFRVVQRSLFGALGLWLLTLVIVGGLSIIWQAIATSGGWLGLLVAIVGSAYITSGLAAAHLVFYRERVASITGAAAR
jgi:hypothetical protein